MDPIRLESQPVWNGPETTTFGIFGTSPESPDGKRICYTRFLRTPAPNDKAPVSGQLWICDHNLANHRKLTDFRIKPIHNASRASWIDNDRIAYSAGSEIQIIDIDSSPHLSGPWCGDLGHSALGPRLLFWSLNKDGQDAVFVLDANTETVDQLTSTAQIRACTEAATGSRIGSFSIKHLQYNPDGSRIGFRLHGPATDMLTMRPDGSELCVYPAQKPVHQLWFNNDTIMGVWKRAAPAGKDSHYFRWNLRGEMVEPLAGPISHGAASPDRKWYAGETCEYFASPIEMAIYRRGEERPRALCFSHSFASLTWGRRFHVNPAFGRNGKRLYFWQAVADDKVEARYVDLTPILA